MHSMAKSLTMARVPRPGQWGWRRTLTVRRRIPTVIEVDWVSDPSNPLASAGTAVATISASYDAGGTYMGGGLVDYADHFQWYQPGVITIDYEIGAIDHPTLKPYACKILTIGLDAWGLKLLSGSCPVIVPGWGDYFDYNFGIWPTNKNPYNGRITAIRVMAWGSIL